MKESKIALSDSARLISIEEAAHVLGVKKDSAYRLINDGDLPSVYVRRRRLVDRRDIDRFIDRQKV